MGMVDNGVIVTDSDGSRHSAQRIVFEALRSEYVTSRRTGPELLALCGFVVEHYATVQSGDWSKAELIRQAYDAGLITSNTTGGGNGRLFADVLTAAGAAIDDIATTDDATARYWPASTSGQKRTAVRS